MLKIPTPPQLPLDTHQKCADSQITSQGCSSAGRSCQAPGARSAGPSNSAKITVFIWLHKGPLVLPGHLSCLPGSASTQCCCFQHTSGLSMSWIGQTRSLSHRKARVLSKETKTNKRVCFYFFSGNVVIGSGVTILN